MTITVDLVPGPTPTLTSARAAVTLDLAASNATYASAVVQLEAPRATGASLSLNLLGADVALDEILASAISLDAHPGAVSTVSTGTPAVITLEIGQPGPQGPPGPPGPPGEPSAYTHSQTVADASWTIHHDLPYRPNVTVVDSAGTVLIADVRYLDDTTITVNHSWPTAGYAYLS